ncbi:MAG: carboxylating nicotinate-nucleotide diphosphorylase [Eubacteriales bacterium]
MMKCELDLYMPEVDEILVRALKEDIGSGDITTNSTVPGDATAHGRYIAKESGIICGLFICERVFSILGGGVDFKPLKNEGDAVEKGDVIAEISGNARTILTGERVGLNLLQHLSGIATMTKKTVDAVSGTEVKIADTRKATPGLRILEKYAVRVGGGVNHRFNLADGVLIKDNHIVASGSIKNAVSAARKNVPHTLKIEVEVENFEELDEALEAGADIIMLDNMSPENMARAVKTVNGRAITEASGNMGDKSAQELLRVANTGVDIISVGALTHSVHALDISLKLIMD